MKARIKSIIDRIFFTPKPLPPGTYQSIFEFNNVPYRLHLRIEDEGQGILIVNASIVMHLNPTATEIAYHLIKRTPIDEITKEFMERYQVSSQIAHQDIEDFKARIESLIQTPDLDPETFLDMNRVDPNSPEMRIPIRLDCALTYDVPDGSAQLYAPIDRITRPLDTEEWKSILSKTWDAGIPHVVFTGGEPTLRPDLPELIQHAESLGQVTGLITDGLRLSESEYFHDLLMAGLDHLMIILQPDEDQSWEAIRDSINEDVFLTVHLTVTAQNHNRLPKLITKLKDIGVSSVSFSARTKELKEHLSTAQQLAAENGLKLMYDLPVPYSAINPISLEMEEEESSKNGAGRTWLYIEPDGDVLPGQGIKEPLGNFLNDSWITISGNRKLNYKE